MGHSEPGPGAKEARTDPQADRCELLLVYFTGRKALGFCYAAIYNSTALLADQMLEPVSGKAMFTKCNKSFTVLPTYAEFFSSTIGTSLNWIFVHFTHSFQHKHISLSERKLFTKTNNYHLPVLIDTPECGVLRPFGTLVVS